MYCTDGIAEHGIRYYGTLAGSLTRIWQTDEHWWLLIVLINPFMFSVMMLVKLQPQDRKGSKVILFF